MQKLKSFLLSTLLGGLVVVLPIGLMVFLISWVSGSVSNLVEPLASKISDRAGVHQWLATAISVIGIMAICFVLGLIVKTTLGGWLMRTLEDSLLKKIPGYSLIRETVAQFLGAKESPFATVALAAPYDNKTLVSCFVTDRHDNGWYTVFVPTGPNPTSGNMFHLPPDRVHIVKVSVENAMRSIISCGAGSSELINAMKAEDIEGVSPSYDDGEQDAGFGGSDEDK